MSIFVTTHVWKDSKQKGSGLLLMLAIADYADAEGFAYPGVATLAKKIRMSKRTVQYLLRRVRESGELTVKKGAGPRGCNLFRVQMSPGAESHTDERKEEHFGGAKAIAPKSSVNITEPSIARLNDSQEEWKSWREIMEELAGRIDKQTFNTWWRPTRLVGRADSWLLVEVPNQLFCDWLSDHASHVLQIIRERYPGVESIRFVSRSERRRAPKAKL